jgi:penicillin-binding protein 2
VSDRSRLRLIVMQVLVMSLLATLLGRLWFLQIHDGEKYQNLAHENVQKPVVTEATRGLILDDMGRALVTNHTTLVVTVNPSVLRTMTVSERTALFDRLAPMLKTTPANLVDITTPCGPGAKPYVCWTGSPFQPIPVAKDVTEQLALSILERAEDYPGVTAQLVTERAYPAPYGANAAHELGYVGPVTQDELDASKGNANPLQASDLVGRTGLEAEYDSVLRGVDGIKQLSVDRARNVTGVVSETPPQAGNNLVTNVDSRVQAVLEQQLAAAVQRARNQTDPDGHHYKADSAAGVVMDVTNGHIIAMASLPTYDPSIWVGGITAKEYTSLTAKSSGQPLVSRAYQGGFAPGSTFKVVSSTAMLASGRYSTAGPYPCPSSLTIGGRKFTNSESKSYGNISLERAIEVSCDTVFYGVAENEWQRDGGPHPVHPKDIFINAALRWGFGKTTGVDLPGESAGNITTRQDRIDTWKKNRAEYCARAKSGYPEVAKTDPAHAAYLKAIAADNCSAAGALYLPGDAVNFIIGQGETLTTPLKMAQIYAAIGNGGTLWTPQVAKAVVSPTGKVVQVVQPKAEGKLPVSKGTLSFLQHALSQVTVKGTADNQFKDWPLNQIPIAAKTGTAEVAGKQTTSWFATYAPANKPKYAVVMMVSQGGFGSTTSADSVKAVYRALLGVHGKTVDPKTSVLPNGVLPVRLPVTTPDGQILPPGSPLPKPTATATPSASSTPLTSGNASGSSGSGSGSTPAALPAPPAVFGSSPERSRTMAGGP